MVEIQLNSVECTVPKGKFWRAVQSRSHNIISCLHQARRSSFYETVRCKHVCKYNVYTMPSVGVGCKHAIFFSKFEIILHCRRQLHREQIRITINEPQHRKVKQISTIKVTFSAVIELRSAFHIGTCTWQIITKALPITGYSICSLSTSIDLMNASVSCKFTL